MMKQLKIMLGSLKNPTVLLSVIAQVCTILTLLGLAVNVDIVTGLFTAFCSIFVTLGIMSNPNKPGIGMGEIVHHCDICGKGTIHAVVNGKLVCTACGTEQSTGK